MQGDGGHAAADVATNGRWVNRLSGRDDCPDADVLRQMNVRQKDDVPDVLGLTQSLGRLRDLDGEGLGTPDPQRGA